MDCGHAEHKVVTDTTVVLFRFMKNAIYTVSKKSPTFLTVNSNKYCQMFIILGSIIRK